MKRRSFYILVAMFLVLAAAAQAEAKEGFYVGLGTSYNTISGDFDGSSGLVGGSQLIILPKIDNAFGIDLRAGYQMPIQLAVELDLMRTVHSGNWAGLQGDVTHTGFAADAKYVFHAQEVVQPFVLAGMSYNELLIERGAADLWSGATGNAKLRGLGLDLGFGVDTYLDPHVSLGLGFTYRIVDYSEASALGQTGTIDNGVTGDGYSLGLNVAYHF